MKKLLNPAKRELGKLLKERAAFHLFVAKFTQEEQMRNFALTGEAYRGTMAFAVRELKIAFELWKADLLNQLGNTLDQ